MILIVKAQISETGPVVTVRGRDARALLELKAANDNGCTPIEHPGPRWSGYVHKLRKLGIVIETLREAHGGPFSGQHARYVLRSLVFRVCRLDRDRPNFHPNRQAGGSRDYLLAPNI